MKRLALFLIGLFILCAAFNGEAKDIELIKIEKACVIEPPPASPNAAAFMTLTNETDHTLTIIAVDTPVAKKAELHKTLKVGELSEMRHVKKLTLAPRESLKLSHDGYHLMLIGLKKRLKRGEKVRLVFSLKDGSSISVDADVCRMKRR